MVKNNKTEKNSGRIKLHRSFRRSYREDYERKTETPGLMAHAAAALRIIRKNWKIFLPLIGLVVLLYIILVGLMAESTFVEFKESVETTNKELVKGRLGNLGRAGLTLIGTVTTGGLTNMNDAQKIFAILLFLITWLVSIYLTRHLLAGHKPKMRDGLYNALSPLVSTFFVGLIVFIELIPIMLVIITYQAAISTEFLKTPFYALVYFIFASLMTLLSVYLASSSIMGLIAVSAPGLYPLTAIETARNLVAGRRIRFLIRIVYLIFCLAFWYVVIVLPAILLDILIKGAFPVLKDLNIPFVPFVLLVVTVFLFVFISIYFYLFYRQLLDYKDDFYPAKIESKNNQKKIESELKQKKTKTEADQNKVEPESDSKKLKFSLKKFRFKKKASKNE